MTVSQHINIDEHPSSYAPVKCVAQGTITLEIGKDGRDPDCVESDALDIATVFSCAHVAGHARVISSGKLVCDKLCWVKTTGEAKRSYRPAPA